MSSVLICSNCSCNLRKLSKSLHSLYIEICKFYFCNGGVYELDERKHVTNNIKCKKYIRILETFGYIVTTDSLSNKYKIAIKPLCLKEVFVGERKSIKYFCVCNLKCNECEIYV
jgi:hypothetical protein